MYRSKKRKNETIQQHNLNFITLYVDNVGIKWQEFPEAELYCIHTEKMHALP